VTDGIRNGRAADGLIQAIEHAGELLSQHFPRGADDRNELINELKLID
jgi:putative membrane protein